eukprot:TRINITY_DN35_c0_g1_i2.p2 TRINITY_DN35_c0_g1~~TRINITY_DN35_c0_g1_i2.p2  ORF type:complete len:114 (+),score=0.95 TRINITY_DN35_c0_g1_i2:508-849(+)
MLVKQVLLSCIGCYCFQKIDSKQTQISHVHMCNKFVRIHWLMYGKYLKSSSKVIFPIVNNNLYRRERQLLRFGFNWCEGEKQQQYVKGVIFIPSRVGVIYLQKEMYKQLTILG